MGPRGGRPGEYSVSARVIPGNFRLLSFGGPGAETVVKCKGLLPTACLRARVGACDPCPCLGGSDPDAPTPLKTIGIFAKEVRPLCQRSGAGVAPPPRVLIIGVGGGALPQGVLQQCSKETRVEAVELDPRALELGKKYFGLDSAVATKRLHLEVGDGLSALERRAAKIANPKSEKAGKGASYDAVVVDCAGEAGEIPVRCRNKRFIEAVFKVLAPGGVLVQNVPLPKARTELQRTYQAVFGKASAAAEDSVRLDPVPDRPNAILRAQKP